MRKAYSRCQKRFLEFYIDVSGSRSGVDDDDYEFIEITHEDLGFARYKLTEKKVKVVKSKTDKFKIICVILFAQKIAIGFFPCINYFFLSFHVITHLDVIYGYGMPVIKIAAFLFF